MNTPPRVPHHPLALLMFKRNGRQLCGHTKSLTDTEGEVGQTGFCFDPVSDPVAGSITSHWSAGRDYER